MMKNGRQRAIATEKSLPPLSKMTTWAIDIGILISLILLTIALMTVSSLPISIFGNGPGLSEQTLTYVGGNILAGILTAPILFVAALDIRPWGTLTSNAHFCFSVLLWGGTALILPWGIFIYLMPWEKWSTHDTYTLFHAVKIALPAQIMGYFSIHMLRWTLNIRNKYLNKPERYWPMWWHIGAAATMLILLYVGAYSISPMLSSKTCIIFYSSLLFPFCLFVHIGLKKVINNDTKPLPFYSTPSEQPLNQGIAQQCLWVFITECHIKWWGSQGYIFGNIHITALNFFSIFMIILSAILLGAAFTLLLFKRYDELTIIKKGVYAITLILIAVYGCSMLSLPYLAIALISTYAIGIVFGSSLATILLISGVKKSFQSDHCNLLLYPPLGYILPIQFTVLFFEGNKSTHISTATIIILAILALIINVKINKFNTSSI